MRVIQIKFLPTACANRGINHDAPAAYTQVNSQVGFWQRRTAIDFEVVSIAQLIQVELLRQSASLLQTQGASLPKFQLSNSLGYICIVLQTQVGLLIIAFL